MMFNDVIDSVSTVFYSVTYVNENQFFIKIKSKY